MAGVSDDGEAEVRALEVRAALDELESEMTHVLKNPLAGMVLSSTRIQRMVAALPGQGKLAAVCDHLCDAVAKLNDGIARFDALDILPPAIPRETDVRVLLGVSIALARGSARSAVSLMPPSDLPPVRIDPVFVSGALRCLIEQAAEVLSAGSVSVVAWHDGERCVHVDIGREVPRPTFDGDPAMLRPLKQGRMDRLGVGIARRLLEMTGGELVVDEVGGHLSARVSLPTARPGQLEGRE